ncbi:MFS transporter [Sphingomonas sp. MA1305]|uniref:MFS transporter n=1 Tax=Sphingomonas sp. MA1305 TaxID=2479204 RepID=UPI0018E03774|nr:MFS transporter [Sphingomonas sp. MA1305]
MRTGAAREPGSASQGAGSPPTALFALAVGVVVLALYASQPLVGIIGPELGLSPVTSGLATTLTLLGYATGLFLLVPLTDLVENRQLILTTLAANVCALLMLAAAPTAAAFLIASFLVGLSTSAIQMLVPVAASLSSESSRGRTVGNVMSGLMLGILFSRPLASLVTEAAGWRSLYTALGVAVAALALGLARFIPRIRPNGQTGYPQLIGSLGSILREEPTLRQRAATQAMCMGAFGVFWTAIALRLAQPPIALGQTGIALFALAGAAGAIISPIAGRAGDRGATRPATMLAHAAVATAMILAYFGGEVFAGSRDTSLAFLLSAAIVLDLGVIADQTLGRRAINLIRPEARGRINGLFTGLFFLGGAAGSALSGVVWSAWGWRGVCATGLAFGIGAIVIFLTRRRVFKAGS